MEGLGWLLPWLSSMPARILLTTFPGGCEIAELGCDALDVIFLSWWSQCHRMTPNVHLLDYRETENSASFKITVSFSGVKNQDSGLHGECLHMGYVETTEAVTVLALFSSLCWKLHEEQQKGKPSYATAVHSPLHVLNWRQQRFTLVKPIIRYGSKGENKNLF